VTERAARLENLELLIKPRKPDRRTTADDFAEYSFTEAEIERAALWLLACKRACTEELLTPENTHQRDADDWLRVPTGCTAGCSTARGFAGRTVPATAWANRFLASELTDGSGYAEFGDLVSAEEDGISGVLPDDGAPSGQTIVVVATTAATAPHPGPSPPEMR
jgi:hypothetical protein